jgi:hypothetical protein
VQEAVTEALDAFLLLWRTSGQRELLGHSDPYSQGQLTTLEVLSPVTSELVTSLDAFQPSGMTSHRVLTILSTRLGDVVKYVSRLLINTLQVRLESASFDSKITDANVVLKG